MRTLIGLIVALALFAGAVRSRLWRINWILRIGGTDTAAAADVAGRTVG